MFSCISHICVSLGVIFLLVSAQAHACEDFERQLDQADELIRDNQLDDAEGSLKNPKFAACVLQPMHVGRFYMLMGHLKLSKDEKKLAREFFRSAQRTGDVEIRDRDRGASFYKWWDHAGKSLNRIWA